MKSITPCNRKGPDPASLQTSGSPDQASEQELRGNDAIVESMEMSCDFPALPTMAWIPLRGIHIPTKPTAALFHRENENPKQQNQLKD